MLTTDPATMLLMMKMTMMMMMMMMMTMMMMTTNVRSASGRNMRDSTYALLRGVGSS